MYVYRWRKWMFSNVHIGQITLCKACTPSCVGFSRCNDQVVTFGCFLIVVWVAVALTHSSFHCQFCIHCIVFCCCMCQQLFITRSCICKSLQLWVYQLTGCIRQYIRVFSMMYFPFTFCGCLPRLLKRLWKF